MDHFDARLSQFLSDLGRRIRLARERRSMTQAEAAAAAALTPNVWSKLENGRFVNPGLRTLARVAWSWDGSVADLLSEAPRLVDTPRLRSRAQLAALVQGEGGALVEERALDQVAASTPDGEVGLSRGRILRRFQGGSPFVAVESGQS